jgi:predicted butyrate kinase (DUF1464 family)
MRAYIEMALAWCIALMVVGEICREQVVQRDEVRRNSAAWLELIREVTRAESRSSWYRRL